MAPNLLCLHLQHGHSSSSFQPSSVTFTFEHPWRIFLLIVAPCLDVASHRAPCNFPTATAVKQVLTQLAFLRSHGKRTSRWDTLIETGLQKATGIKSKLKFGSRHMLKQGLVRWKDKAVSATESPGSCPPFIYAIWRHARQQRYTYKKAKPLFSLWLYVSSQRMRCIYKKCTILSEIPNFLAFEPTCKVLIYGGKKKKVLSKNHQLLFIKTKNV